MPNLAEEKAYEVHLTVQLNGQEPEALASFAKEYGCRFLHLLLDAGTCPSQTMLSWRQSQGVDAALRRSAILVAELERRGMASARIKVEAEAVAAAEAEYFEAHFKLEFDEAQAPELARLAKELGAHMSRNARSRIGGKQQHFLTARERTGDQAQRSFDRVEAALKSGGWRLLSVEREAVLYDSNFGLDEGWAA